MTERRIATVLMLDVVGSTEIAAQMGDARYRELSSRFDRIVRTQLRRSGGREEDNAGDGFFATFPQPDRAIRSAAAIADEVRSLGIEIRCGIHTGQTELRDGKAQGIAVVIGARVMSLAGAGEVLVTSTTKELVTGSGFDFEDFSAHELKGVPGTWQVFAVTKVDGDERVAPLPAAEAAERRTAIKPSGRSGRRSRRLGAIVGGVVLVAAVAMIAVAAIGDDEVGAPTGNPSGFAPESAVQIDPASGDVRQRIEAPAAQLGPEAVRPETPAHPMVVGEGAVWIQRSFRWLLHVDPLVGQVRRQIDLPGGGFSRNVAAGHGSIWVAIEPGLVKVNPATDEPSVVYRTPGSVAMASEDVAVGAGSVWLGTGTGLLVRLDPRTGERRRVEGLDPINYIGFGHGNVWTADAFAETLSTYDPVSMERRTTFPVGETIDNFVVGDVGVWVLSRSLGALIEVDPDTGETKAVPLGSTGSTGLAVGDGAIWVGDEDGVIRRVDEDTRQVTEIPFGAPIRALAYDEETDTLWIDVAPD
jgi:class 3 adenylate cyclase/streptogramin lyase